MRARSSSRPAIVPSMRLSTIVMRTPPIKSGSTFWVTSNGVLKAAVSLATSVSRSAFESGRAVIELLRQGIRIYEFHKGVEHSKYIVLDEDWSTVGSCNFDERSMRLNFELSLLSFDRETNATLAGIFLETISQSQEIDRTTFARRSFGEKLVESGLRLLSPLL